jgi:hypothetical protein
MAAAAALAAVPWGAGRAWWVWRRIAPQLARPRFLPTAAQAVARSAAGGIALIAVDGATTRALDAAVWERWDRVSSLRSQVIAVCEGLDLTCDGSVSARCHARRRGSACSAAGAPRRAE